MARIFNLTGGSGGGKLRLESIRITAPPEKVVYRSGETFDPTGMTVEAVYTNGAKRIVTGYTCSPLTLLDGTDAVTVTFAEEGVVRTVKQPVTVTPVLAGLEVRVQPDKTAYRYLEAFDPAGMEVDAVYSDGARQAVTGYTYPAAAFAVLGAQEVTLSYTEDGRTVTASVPVTVSAVTLPVPAQAGALTYNGSAQSPVWNGYDSAKMTLSGETSGTDAGAYHAQFALAYGYEWPDGSAEPASVPWTIGRAVIAQLPAVSGTLTFDGTEQSPTFIGYDPDKMTLGGDTAATEPGDYAATFTPTANYQWADGSTSAKSVAWTIANVVVTIPHQVGALTYNGAEQSPAWEGFDAEHSTISGDRSATDAGDYTAVFTLTLGVWEDGTKTPKAVPWSISRAVIPAVPTQNGTLTYTGNPQSPTLSGYDPAKMTLGGTTTATDAGEYTASVTPTANYCWTDGSTGAKTVTWRIAGVTVAVPTQSGALNYYPPMPQIQSPSWNGYDTEKMTIGGTTSAKDAGNYEAIFTLKPNYQWPDGTTDPKTVVWVIGKAEPIVNPSPSSLSLTSSSPTGRINLGSRIFSGKLSAFSNNTEIATVSEKDVDPNEDTFFFLVTGKANGTATITVTSEEDNNYFAGSWTVEVTVSFGPVAKLEPTAGVTYTSGISSLSYEKLNEYAHAISDNASITKDTSVVYIDDGDNYYKINTGDQIAMSIESANSDWNGVNTFKVIGFNHDELSLKTAYGEITATGKAGITILSSEFKKGHRMNASSTNDKGYFKSELYFFIANNVLPKPSFRKYWKSVIKTASEGNQSTNIVKNETLQFLLSEVELLGRVVASAPGEGEQYAYYKAANASARAAPPEHLTWTRSPVVQNNTSFVAMFNSKSSYKEYATNSNYVSFAMCI